MPGRPALDPVCVFHGKRRSEHICLYCEICFRSDLAPDDCAVDENGQKWNVCKGQCAVEAGVVEAVPVCRCGGDGWYVGHGDKCWETGVCKCSGVQILCEACGGTGVVQ